MERIRRLLPAVLVASLAAGVAACAGPDGAADRAGTPAAPATRSAAPSAAPTAAPTRPPGATRAPATPKVDPSAPFELPRTVDPKTGVRETVTGTVVAGVEEGCLLLDGYLLLNPPTGVVKAGARVRVTGQIRTDLVSTCQQGIPLLVESARPA
jgi:hypothetical protein